MKKLVLIISLLLVAAISINAQETGFLKLTGPYLGQKTPGMKPEIFAPGVVSTASHEFSSCFSPDGKEFYFTRRHPELNQTVVMQSKLVDGVWTEPIDAPFVEKKITKITFLKTRKESQFAINVAVKILIISIVRNVINIIILTNWLDEMMMGIVQYAIY